MSTYTLMVSVRARPKPASGQRKVWMKKHQLYAGFREEMDFVVPGAWGRDPLKGPLRVHTEIIIDNNKGGADANNLHSGILDALEGHCYFNDKSVVEGSYKLTVKEGANKITCRITTLHGKGARSGKAKSGA